MGWLLKLIIGVKLNSRFSMKTKSLFVFYSKYCPSEATTFCHLSRNKCMDFRPVEILAF